MTKLSQFERLGDAAVSSFQSWTPQSIAEVVELADAHGSGPCTRKGVGVRVPPSAPNIRFRINSLQVQNPFEPIMHPNSTRVLSIYS